ncbi:MAG: lactate utilization protein [Candidatus Helarchaeota archaeon]|nr:lactate utilization protein [Candidatus Helarchaeota archaeon]
MSDKGKVSYENIKKKISRLTEQGTKEKQFVDFWRLGCETKGEIADLRYGYDDSSREFVEKYKDRLIKIREDFIENMDYYVEKCIERMRKTNQFKVYYAKTNQEAQKIFMEELGENKVIYKSMTNEAKDIGILRALKKNNIEIRETEIGEILVELFDYKLPTYQLGHGAHFTVNEIVAKMKEVHGVDIEPRVEAIVKYYRDTYRPELLNNVTVALTSANAIAADDGSIVLVEGSGNISLITRATEKHIVAVGITKIVPTFFDALLVAKMQARAPTVSMAYMSIIFGPSGTSSIQGGRTIGMYGTKEVVVILVDEWRTRAAKENLIYKSLLKCIACRSCNFVCTSSRAFGNVFGGRFGLGATAIIREYIHDGIEAAVKSGLFLCTGCEKCSKWCPAGVDLAEMMRNLKREASQKGLCPPPLSEYRKKILENKNPF